MDDIIRTTSPDQVRIERLGKLRIEVAGMGHPHPSCVHIHTPLTVLKPELLQEELLADVVEPVCVALQGGTLQPWCPELKVGQILILIIIIVHSHPGVTIADGAVVVLVHGPSNHVGHRH